KGGEGGERWSRAGGERLGRALATKASTSQCKRPSRKTHRTQQDEASEIRSFGWPGKKWSPLQMLRKSGAPDRAQPLPVRRRTSSRPAIQRLFPVIRAAILHRVATRLRTRMKYPKHQRPN